MSWIDVGIIGLVVLCGLIGVLRGVQKSLLSLGAFFIAFILAFFLANVIAEALIGMSSTKGFVLGDGNFGGDGFSLANWLYKSMFPVGEDGVIVSNLPGEDTFLYEKFYKPVLDIIGSAKVEVDPTYGLAMYYAFMMFSAMVGVALFIIVRFLLVIVTVIIKSYIGKRKTVMTRLFGFAVGFVHGGLWALVITLIFSCMGGLPVSAFSSIEGEYEHPNAVFCQHINSGAYAIRNSMFLPSADMYGRIVNEVIITESEGPKGDKLSGHRLELFINLNNLNYDNHPWSINEATRLREFDENGAIARTGSEFKLVGFEQAYNAILEYNAAVAAAVDNLELLTDIDETMFGTYNDMIATGNTSVSALMDKLTGELRAYKQDYKTAGREDADDINWTARLKTDYDNILDTINAIKAQFAALGGSVELTLDVSALIPDCVTPVPGGAQEPVESPNEGGDE